MIGETGFGFGLNFLAAWEAWRDAGPRGARLRFISFERDLPGREDAARALSHFSELEDLTGRLLARWPAGGEGRRIVELSEDVRLELILGDVAITAPRASFEVDAWFLDGFSPAANLAMWTPELMREVARLSAPGATAATFTAAGAVRRALEAAGFAAERRPGFGRKRHMTAARLERPFVKPAKWNWATVRPPERRSGKIAVLGAGLAGAAAARALRARGIAVEVFDDPERPGPSRRNPVGLVAPKQDGGEGPTARFHRDAFAFAVDLYERLDIFEGRGVRRPSKEAGDRTRADAFCDHPGFAPARPVVDGDDLLWNRAGWVAPSRVVAALLEGLDVRSIRIDRLARDGEAFILHGGDAPFGPYDAVVLCGGAAGAPDGCMAVLPLARSRGQITCAELECAAPRQAMTAGRYLAPLGAQRAAFGATYRDVDDDEVTADPADDADNLAALKELAPEIAARIDASTLQGVAGLRAVTADRAPLVGPMSSAEALADHAAKVRAARPEETPAPPIIPGLFVLSGLGSRGLVTAPYAGEVLAAHILGEPAPVDGDVLAALHPARFAMRAARRGEL